MIGRTIGHYRILAHLGGGGMGVVYKAEDTRLGRIVALKLLPPELTRDAEAKRRFEREARAASLLDHPNICTMYDFGETEGDGQMYIAMACYDGESLADRVTRGPPLSLDEAIRILEQICRGLGKAHTSGVVHRDIKPANVMLTSDGVVKIVDFGLAKLSAGSQLTKSRSSIGTAAYMAPEQLRGAEVGPQADIWSSGIVLFELLTGTRPFRGEYAEALSYSILNEQPATITELRPDLPVEIDRIIKRMLRKDPLQRYATTDDVIAELEVLRTPSAGAGKSEPRSARLREPLRAGAKLGPYEIIEPLGSGGMGDVYRARDTRLDRQVALKVLAPEFSEDAERKQRFQREAKTISSLSHPNICTLFDVGEQEGSDFLVMEFLEGETLAEKKGPLPIPQVLKIGIQIAEGLAAAHRQGIVHRDLKPGNVIITKSGTVKLLDFGLAKEAGAIAMKARGGDDMPLTAEGMIVGTLPYMAPEQIEGTQIDARTDIFAFGTMLYEMVTGKRAFEGKTRASLIVAIIDHDPLPITTLQPGESPVLVHVINKCLKKEPDNRWQSARDIATELQWIEEGGRAALGLPRQRRALAGTALVAVVVVAVALAFGMFLAGRATVRQPEAAAAPIARLTKLTFLEGVEGQPSISPDGSAFVYVADTTEGNSDIFFQRVGGETAINLTKDSTEPDYHPAFSPDGQTVAYRSGAPAGVGGIYLMGATGESRRRLTDFGFNPAWSHDGKYIAVATESIFGPTGRHSASELWRIDVASGEKKKLATPGDAVQPSFSPNGRRIAYWGLAAAESGGKRVLATMPFEGGQAVTLTDDRFFNWNPIWSPDGRYLYFASNRSGTMNLWRMPIDEGSGNARGPAERVTTAGEWNGQAAISSNGKLLYAATHGSTTLVRFPLDPTTFRAGFPVSVLGSTRDFWQADPSPDGVWLALIGFDIQEDIFVAKTDGSGLRRLTNDRYRDRGAAWSPDSATVYFYSDRSGRYELWRISLDGGGLEQVTRTSGASPSSPRVSPDGRYLLTAGSQLTRSAGLYDLSRPLPFSEPEWIPPIGPDREFSYVNIGGVWSPNSRQLVGMSRSLRSGFPGIYVYSLDEKKYEKLTDHGDPIGWLPDGRTILFLDRATIFAIDRVSRTTREVASIPKGYPPTNVEVSRDGRWIYMLRSDLEGDIWMLEYEPMRSGTKSVTDTQ